LFSEKETKTKNQLTKKGLDLSKPFFYFLFNNDGLDTNFIV
jgi:hypothetical protein